MPNSVHPKITDSVTQTSSHVLGLGPALAATFTYLGQTQAQNVLFANMVSQQQQSALQGLTATTQNIKKLLDTKVPKRQSIVQHSSYIEQEKIESGPDPRWPVVT